MQIPFAHGASLRSQCRQRVIANAYCDNTVKRRKQQTLKMRHKNTMSLAFLFVVLLCQAGHAKKDIKCPANCSCAVESTVFCNNKGFTSTPVDFSPAVEMLYLFNNNITTISTRTLQPLKNLKILDISGNRITNFVLWDGIFSQLKQLENLILQENQITKITSDMFKGMTNLARIYLQRNQISVIEDGAFDNLPNLVELKLRNNRITSFPKFENTPNLLLLDLGHNKLRTIKDMALSTVNVEQLLLQNNHLTQLRTSVFDDTSRLNHLDISNNRLTAFPQIVKSLSSLRILNISLNKIDTIPRDTFNNLVALKSLYMRGMGLKSLPQGFLPRRVILNELDITENNWDCDCGMRWLPQYIRIFEQAFIHPNMITCSSTSRLKNRIIQELTESDFECTEEEIRIANSGSIPATTSSSAVISSGRKTPWSADPCDVFPCFHGGTCVVVGRHPRCKCAQYWTGSQCKRSKTRSTRSTTTTTTTTTPTTTTTTTTSTIPTPKLLINTDSITEHTVEIILPLTDTELLVSVSEIGEKRPAKEFAIRPKAHPFTVQNLESGRSYNICIHLPLGSGDGKPGTGRKDTLCGIVKTEGVRVENTPVSKPEITVVPSPGVSKTEYPTNDNKQDNPEKAEADLFNPGIDEELYGANNPETTPSSGFQILYPAIGAGIGAVIIVILLAMFCICRRQKRILKLKQQNSPDYIPGSPVESNHTDMEMATVVHHHHHNHYNAGGVESKKSANSPNKENSQSPKSSTRQSSFVNTSSNSNRANRANRTNSSSSSNSSGIHDTSPLYTTTQGHHQPALMLQMKYEHLPPQMNGRGNEYLYGKHQDSNGPVPALDQQWTSVSNGPVQAMENHCHPQSRPQRISGNTQPLVGSMNPYYDVNDRYAYPVSPMNVPTYIPPYPQTSPRSAFQPVQAPRNNAVLSSSSSESVPLTTRVSTAHVMPTSSVCLNRNLMNGNMPRYHEGVQVV